MLLLKHGREKKSLVPLLKEWIPLLREVWKAANREEALSVLIRYILLVNRKTNAEELRSELGPLLGEGLDEVIMTDVQRMMAQVRKETEQRLRAEIEADRAARVKAEQEAREVRASAEKEARESRVRAVLAILRARGLSVSDAQRAQIEACTDLSALDRWLDRAVIAQSVDDVIRDA